MRQRRDAVPADAADAAGAAVARQLLALPELAPPARVAVYAALPGELPTGALFRALREQGRVPLFPRCAERRLEFAPAERFEDLAPGRYGVAEPVGPAVALVPDDAVVVPGLAFDARGRRLGYGGGWYDRTFPPGASAPFLVGVGFDVQRVESVPAGATDRVLDALVTERGTFRTREGGSLRARERGEGEG
jgi:5-formyltetrahydrofolate cyclo-ligase